MNTLAITGASGFLGRHLVSKCLSLGFKVRLLLRHSSSSQFQSKDNIVICQGDLLNPASLNGFLEPNCTLIHLAYIDNNRSANMEAALNLIEAAKGANVARIVHCSTAVVVGFKENKIITETTLPQPEGEYQVTKLEIEEKLCSQLPASIELAILRPSEIIGPEGQGMRIIIERLASGKTLKNYLLHCILKNRRLNYVSVHNVVAALILLATTTAKQNKDIYNISDDDDPDNNYASVEGIINSYFGYKTKYFFDLGIAPNLLQFLFKMLPTHSHPRRIYSYSKIATLGYKKVRDIKSTILDILSQGQNNAYP
jgi:nucleoside-diphosphate-sugar epimerase